jgi:hypothetical protein
MNTEICKSKTVRCINCNEHFQRLKPLILEVALSKNFHRDAPGFDVSPILGCDHDKAKRLHKFEFSVDGSYVFRAILKNTHVVYAVDAKNRLIFLRAFGNFKDYSRFLKERKNVAKMIQDS